MLAMSGCLMQVLLRNPLADPYVLGVSGGAAFATLLGHGIWHRGRISAVAGHTGSPGFHMIVFGLARGTGPWSGTRLLLTGVVTASGWAALISLILSLSPDNSLRGMLFWLMGDLSYATLPLWSLVVLAGSFILTLGLARSLNVLAMGETTARLLGEPTRHMLWLVYLLASVLTATAVSIAGSIGFCGIDCSAPDASVGGFRPSNPDSGRNMFGGLFLVLSDTLARTLSESATVTGWCSHGDTWCAVVPVAVEPRKAERAYDFVGLSIP